ncbi:MAG: sodium:solute symporter [Candidatus Omnitrophota bacterium]
MPILLILYALIFLVIGLNAASRIRTPDDFFVAGRRGNSLHITASLLATILGSSAILGTIAMAETAGSAAVWLLISGAAGLTALLPLAKYVRRYGRFTLPELLETFYGQTVKRTASAMIPLAWTGVIAVQVIGSAKILAYLTPLSYHPAAVLCGTAFILYTVLGGQLSIFRTDYLQLGFIVTGLLFAVTAARQAHPDIALFTPNFPFNTEFSPWDLMVLFLTYASLFTVGPDIYSRLFCARNEQSAFFSVLLTAALMIPAALALTVIGVTGAQHSFEFLTSGPLPFIIGIGLLSAVISSADTTLLTAAAISGGVCRDIHQHSSLALTRWLILVFGAISTVIALAFPRIIPTLMLAFSFFSGAFIIPTIAGLLGYRAGTGQVMTAIVSGGTLALTGKILTLTGLPVIGNSVIISAFPVNALILFLPRKIFSLKK